MLREKYKKIYSYFALPTLWRYFLGQYAKVFFLSLFGFLVILLSARLEDFARFVSLGANLPSAFLYILYQIPYVLQIALPISSLIASLYLFTRLSQNNALTAIRAAGISLFEVVSPLIIMSALAALLTFQVVLDISASAHFAAKRLEFRLRSMNPLALMHNAKLLQQNGISVEMKGSLQHDSKTSDFIMALRDSDNKHTALFIAKEMSVQNNQLRGKNLSFITTIPIEDGTHYNHLIIENAKENVIELQDISKAITTKRLKVGNEELRLPLLIAKKNGLIADSTLDTFKKRDAYAIDSCRSEIARRFSLAVSIVTFCLVGMAYGSTIGRTLPRRRIVTVLFLTSFFLVCYLGAKSFEYKSFISIGLYILPHVVLMSLAIRRLVRLHQGREV